MALKECKECGKIPKNQAILVRILNICGVFMYEQRSDKRIEVPSDVYVKVQSAPEARDLEGKDFSFQSEDVSVYGLRLDVDIPVPVGALLELEVKLHNSAMKYRHMGTVVWVDELDDDDAEQGYSHEIGIRLQTQSNPQFDSWSAAVSNLQTAISWQGSAI